MIDAQGSAPRTELPSPPPLRRAGAPDAARLAGLARSAYGSWEPLVGCVPEPMAADWSAVLAEQEVWILDGPDGAPDASLALAGKPDHLLIWSVVVRPCRQHGGLGRALLASAERRAVKLGLPEVHLYTQARMARNIAIYERAGYARMGLEDRGDRVVQHMAKPLVRPRAEPGGAPEGKC
jgi:ribosomal protein S18 acetylase RimI-like enzyme